MTQQVTRQQISGVRAGLTLLCAVGVFGLTIISSGCSSNTNAPAVTIPNPVRSLQALSVDSTTVRLRWRASTSEANVTSYRVTVTPMSGGGSPSIVTVSRFNPADTGAVYLANIGGLRLGAQYTFNVQARTADTVSAGSAITWAPAIRIRTTTTGAPIRLYESASAFASAIRFQGGVAAPTPIADRAEAARADLAIATPTSSMPNDSLLFGTPSRLYSITGGRLTLLDNTGYYTGVDSLNQIYEPAAISGNFVAGFYGTRISMLRGGVLFYCRTADGNFTKVFARAVNGSIVQGTAPNRYIEVELSYQPIPNTGLTLLATGLTKGDGAIQSGHELFVPGAGTFSTTPRQYPIPLQQR